MSPVRTPWTLKSPAEPCLNPEQGRTQVSTWVLGSTGREKHGLGQPLGCELSSTVLSCNLKHWGSLFRAPAHPSGVRNLHLSLGTAVLGCWERVNGPGKLLCKVGPASPEDGAGKGTDSDPLPCCGDPLSHFTPMSHPPPPPGAAIPARPFENCCQLPCEQYYANSHHYVVL